MIVLHFLAALMSMFEIIGKGATQSDQAHGRDYKIQYRPGDVLIVGLASVHNSENEDCSTVLEEGIQAVETMNMIIDQINADTDILPGIQLGSIIIDTCYSETEVARRVILDILPLFSDCGERYPNLQSGKSSPTLVAGVVGAGSSGVSIQVAKMLNAVSVPQISYWASSPELSNKRLYKYFFRVVPPDDKQVEAIIALAKQRGWSYISIVYDDDSYGLNGFYELQDQAEDEGICIGTFQPVPRTASDQDFLNIVESLLTEKSKVVVMFTNSISASRLMNASAKYMDKATDLLWVGSDGWTNEIPLSNYHFDDRPMHGAVGFQPAAQELKAFRPYFLNLNLEENLNTTRNPWFSEYLELVNSCTVGDDGPGRKCDRNEKVDPNSFEKRPPLEHVGNAMLAIIHALKEFHAAECNGTRGLCPAISMHNGTSHLATKLIPILKRINFTNANGKHVYFDSNQNGLTSFYVFGYDADKEVMTGTRRQRWEIIGDYNNKALRVTTAANSKLNTTESVCSKPCGYGEATVPQAKICCWHCERCAYDEFVSEDDTMCTRCPLGEKPNSEKRGCDLLTITAISYESEYGIACAWLSCLGLLLTLIVTGIYIVHRKTPMVKSSGNELSFFILFGIIVSFLNFLAMTASPTFPSCVTARIILGVGPACIYAGLLTKTVRVVIMFRTRSSLSKQMKLYLQPSYQIVVTSALVMVQVLVAVLWLILSPVAITMHYPTHEMVYRGCAHLVDLQVLLAMSYPLLLITVCTVLTTLNRNIPTEFNETKCIGFSMYSTCVIWLAFLSIFITNTEDLSQRILTTSICVSLSATTVLVCFFGPKCFKIVFRPSLNNINSVMSPKNGSCYRSTTASTIGLRRRKQLCD